MKNLKNKEFKNSLNKLLPQKLIIPIIDQTEIDEYKKVNSITKNEREKLIKILKNFTLTIKGFRPVEDAIVTSGGISIKRSKSKNNGIKTSKWFIFCRRNFRC